ncbi:MAG TPA: FAD-dependent oxidoreductase [Gammaproteobacteria bacterium]|nr:FAD-dependent oxidoreductase [Gammaproteobacteria bacterium]
MAKVSGPDLSQGVPAGDIRQGSPLLGHVGESGVLLANLGDAFSAVSAECTHYHGPLAEGLVVGETVRCPWHHACFSLRNGELLAAPGLNPLQRWKVDRQGDRLFVREKLPPLAASTRQAPANAKHPESVLIVGGGAAGEAAATALRFHGYKGPVTIISAEAGLPPDRPNLSKDFLAGTAPAAWVPVRGEKYFKQHDITLLHARVESIDAGKKLLRTSDGQELRFGALLLATGAEPVKLPTPGADQPHVHYLRTLADSESIIKGVEVGAKRVVVIGASFIGLEVAASLRSRGLEVHVVGPEARPLERVLGPQLGDFVRRLHEKKGVIFHLGQTVSVIGKDAVTLSGGTTLGAELVVIGVGVRPVTALAEQLGLKLDKGVVVDAYLQTSIPGIYAAGDIARWPDPRSGAIRVEHWVVAQRQGQTAARNMLGFQEAFDSVPFFWSQHYDVAINYVGHAEKWDEIAVDGDPEHLDCAVSYKQGGKLLALATIYRDKQSLECAAQMAGG